MGCSVRHHVSVRTLTILALLTLASTPGVTQDSTGQRLEASHERLEPEARVDEFGIFVPIPASHPGRRFPAEEGFPTGPRVGERLPDFSLPNQQGETVDFHQHRGNRRAVVMFQRSVVW